MAYDEPLVDSTLDDIEVQESDALSSSDFVDSKKKKGTAGRTRSRKAVKSQNVYVPSHEGEVSEVILMEMEMLDTAHSECGKIEVIIDGVKAATT